MRHYYSLLVVSSQWLFLLSLFCGPLFLYLTWKVDIPSGSVLGSLITDWLILISVISYFPYADDFQICVLATFSQALGPYIQTFIGLLHLSVKKATVNSAFSEIKVIIFHISPYSSLLFVSSRPKRSFRFLQETLQKNLNDLFGQPSISCLSINTATNLVAPARLHLTHKISSQTNSIPTATSSLQITTVATFVLLQQPVLISPTLSSSIHFLLFTLCIRKPLGLDLNFCGSHCF